jgi:hypothetical protein
MARASAIAPCAVHIIIGRTAPPPEVCDAPQPQQDRRYCAGVTHDCRAWKGFDWDVLGRLHDKGLIDDPMGKVKSVVFTPEGLQRAKALFEEMFEE